MIRSNDIVYGNWWIIANHFWWKLNIHKLLFTVAFCACWPHQFFWSSPRSWGCSLSRFFHIIEFFLFFYLESWPLFISIYPCLQLRQAWRKVICLGELPPAGFSFDLCITVFYLCLRVWLGQIFLSCCFDLRFAVWWWRNWRNWSCWRNYQCCGSILRVRTQSLFSKGLSCSIAGLKFIFR